MQSLVRNSKNIFRFKKRPLETILDFAKMMTSAGPLTSFQLSGEEVTLVSIS